MTVTVLHPQRPGPRRSVTYAEPVIREAALNAGKSLTDLVAAITANDLAGARAAARAVSHWLADVAEMRQHNARAANAKVGAQYRQGVMTADELESELAEITVVHNRITQD